MKFALIGIAAAWALAVAVCVLYWVVVVAVCVMHLAAVKIDSAIMWTFGRYLTRQQGEDAAMMVWVAILITALGAVFGYASLSASVVP